MGSKKTKRIEGCVRFSCTVKPLEDTFEIRTKWSYKTCDPSREVYTYENFSDKPLREV